MLANVKFQKKNKLQELWDALCQSLQATFSFYQVQGLARLLT